MYLLMGSMLQRFVVVTNVLYKTHAVWTYSERHLNSELHYGNEGQSEKSANSFRACQHCLIGLNRSDWSQDCLNSLPY